MWVWIAAGCQQEAAPHTPITQTPHNSDAPATANRATWREMWEDKQIPRSPADGGGRVRLIDPPDALVVGQSTELTLEFEVGAHGIAQGGAVVFLGSPFWGWSPPQSEMEGAPGYTLVSGPEGVSFELQSVAQMLVASVQGRALVAGERVRFVYGAASTARTDRFSERSPLWMGVDGDGDGVRAMLPDPVTLRVVAGPPALLVPTLPSAVAPDEPFELELAATDALGNAPVQIDGYVSVQSTGDLGLPTKVRWPSNGILTLTGRAASAGIYWVTVEGPGQLIGRSNPMVVRAGAPPIRWADLQVHTSMSDGTGDPAEVLRYARQIAGLDAVAITDHDHWGPLFLDDHPDLFEQIARATEEAYRPGEFVTVHGYEWTSWLFGHRHVLSFGAPLPMWSSLNEASDTPRELHDLLATRSDTVVIRHHPAGGPVPIDWSFPMDPSLEPVVEVSSVHGQSESQSLPGAIYNAFPDAFIDRQLAKGVRFGMIGSTDGHDGHPGLSQIASGHGGLAALEGASLTRASMLETIRARRVYATNGPRIVLRFTGNDLPMGSLLPAGRDIALSLRVVGTAPIDRVELVTREGIMATAHGDGGLLMHAAWTLDAPAPGELAYVRVIQVDGGLAWSSPIFVDQP